jgi:EAL domain-containing protein (putative c-di-GMP-specific phosphodiesterase class I)/CheY-like chemotaxis protein
MSGLRVLVVDDDDDQRAIFHHVLTQAGIDCAGAPDAATARAEIATGTVGLVLLDCGLGPDDGLDVLRGLRAAATTATLPVILVTANGEIAARVAGLEAGANDFLIKPVDFQELVARVRAQLRTHASLQQSLEDELDDRLKTIRSLGALSASDDLPSRAAVICQELARDEEVTGSAILSFAAARMVIPLAAERLGPAVTPGRALPSVVAKDLQTRAADGPWMQRPGEGSMYLLEWAEPDAYRCFAPLLADGRPVGLLVRTVRPGSSSGRAPQRHLATTIDLAETISSLLLPGLGEHAGRAASRVVLELVMESDAFQPVFQPIVDLTSEQTVGFEALTRFDDGVPPLRRFSEAAGVGLGPDLELVTLRAAARAATALPDNAYLSLNVSAALLLTPGRINRMVPLLEERRVVLELTEHEPIEDYAALRHAVTGLGRIVDLSVDDAGSGFASLRHVLALHPDFVKLDHSWVRGIHDDPARQALVAGLAYFAGETGCRLVAEGIETSAELETVRSLGVHYGQGYLLGKPTPVQELAFA